MFQPLRFSLCFSGEKPFKCKECDKSFNQKGALNIHMTTHTKERRFSCEKCKVCFSQRGNLRAHYVRLHELNSQLENPFRCEECDSAFRKLGSLKSHISKVHSAPEDPLTLLRMGALRLSKQLQGGRNKSKEGTDVMPSEIEPIQVDGPVNQGERSTDRYCLVQITTLDQTAPPKRVIFSWITTPLPPGKFPTGQFPPGQYPPSDITPQTVSPYLKRFWNRSWWELPEGKLCGWELSGWIVPEMGGGGFIQMGIVQGEVVRESLSPGNVEMCTGIGAQNIGKMLSWTFLYAYKVWETFIGLDVFISLAEIS